MTSSRGAKVRGAKKTAARTTKKATAKKTATKKTTKRVVKKVPARSSAQSKDTKKKTSVSKTNARKKTSVVTKSPTTPAREEVKKPSVTSPVINATTLTTGLVTLSPFRFPLQIDVVAIQAARFAGLTLVILGGLMAYSAAGYLQTGSLPQTFEKTGLAALVCDSTTADCLDPVASTNTTINTAIDTKPVVEFLYEAGSVQKNVINLKVKVAGAESVAFYLYDRNNDLVHELGNGVSKTNGVWEYEWRSTSYPDSDYRLKVLVTNQYGRYEALGGYFTVENNPAELDTQTSDTTTDATQANGDLVTTNSNPETNTQLDTANAVPADAVTDETPDVQVDNLATDQGDVLQGTARLLMKVREAQMVTIKLLNLETNKTTTLGNAYQVAGEEWKFAFDTTRHADGKYRLRAQAIYEDLVKDTDTLDVTIRNAVVATDTETDAGVAEIKLVEDQAATDVDGAAIDTSKLAPDIQLNVRDQREGVVVLRVQAKDVQFVEMYAQPATGATRRFVGLASRVDTGEWLFTWNTNDTPNGTYAVTATVKNTYGTFTSKPVSVTVQNNIQVDSDTPERFSSLVNLPVEDVSLSTTDETAKPLPEDREAQTETETETLDDEQREDQTLAETDGDYASIDESVQLVDSLLADYQEDLEKLFRRLAAALRIGDAAAVDQVKTEINQLKQVIIAGSLRDADQAELLAEIDEKLRLTTVRIEAHVKVTEKIVTERTGESAAKDTDQDGITDFDEINIFATNPESADTDGDGFLDGAEILSGYNPNDSTPEVLVEYESPKEAGIVREDLLVVEDVVTVTSEPEDRDGVATEAIITGKALPNSFVTIYIFSTPVVITVKTEADGSWQYRFDKELEDGEHEVYIGVTDNAGKIIAKSEPFVFVKEAQAFTPVDAAAGAPVAPVEGPGLFSQYLIYLVISISVVVIGLMLILLGLHLDRRRTSVAVAEPVQQAI